MQSNETQHDLLRNLRFLRLWLKRPVSLGAVMPSSKSLATAMAAEIDSSNLQARTVLKNQFQVFPPSRATLGQILISEV